MGSKLSYLASPTAKARTEPLVSTDDGDEDDIRPSKRQKTTNSNSGNIDPPYEGQSPRRRPFGHVTNESQRASSRLVDKFQAVQPSPFYGRPRPTALERPMSPSPRIPGRKSRYSKTNIQNFLPDKAIDFKKALRIDVMGIFSKSAQADTTLEFAGGYKNPFEVKCRCSVALFCAKNDDEPSAHIRLQDYSEVHRASKTGILRTTLHNGHVSRELLVDPFVLSSYEFYVTRKRTNKNGDRHFEFDLGDKYYVQVTLDPIGSQKPWPPFDLAVPEEPRPKDDGQVAPTLMDLLHSGKVMKNELCLTCSMPGLLDTDRQVRSVDLKLCHGSDKQKVPYGLHIQMQWSLPNQYSVVPANIPMMESPVKSIAFNCETILGSPVGGKAGQSPLPASTTERSARRRSNIVPTYNLKTLSAQAQGKSPRTRKNISSKSSQGHQSGAQHVEVTYGFGRANAAELGIKQQTTIIGYICPFCHVDEASLEDLRLHLHTNHTNFKFSLRRENASRVGFFVELAKLSPRSSPAERTKTFQLSKSQTLFDLDKFLGGDQSWVKAREGRQHNHWPEHLNDQFHESSLSSSSRDSRHSSPNTPNDTDDVVDVELCPPKKPILRKIFYVPKTSKPLFDTVSKRVLEPGEEIPDSDDEKDEAWLHQKHRDIINDFTDLTCDEKEYITRWNPFIMDTQLGCEKYFPGACERFTEANAAWIVEKKSRCDEFGKQMEMFLMRSIIEQQCFDKCVDVLKVAQRKRRESGKDEDEPKMGGWWSRPALPPRATGFLDCAYCGDQTQPPDQIVCRGPDCKARFYHRACTRAESDRPACTQWLCDNCFGEDE